MAPGVAVALLDLVARDLASQKISLQSGVAGDIVGVRYGAKRRCVQLVSGITGDAEERGVDLQAAALPVDQCHADRRIVEGALEPRLDLAQRTLRFHARSRKTRALCDRP